MHFVGKPEGQSSPCQLCSLKENPQGWAGIDMVIFKRKTKGYSRRLPQSSQTQCCAFSSKALYFYSTKLRLKKNDWVFSKACLIQVSEGRPMSPNTSNDQVCSNLISVLSAGCLKGQILVPGTVCSSDYAAMLILVVLFL